MKKIFTLLAAAFIFAGCQIQPSENANENTQPTQNVSESQQKQTDIVTFSSGAKVEIPKGWDVTLATPNPQFDNYEVKTSSSSGFFMSEIHVAEWLKGPNPDEGYVIPHDQRPKALQVMKDMYDHQKITEDDLKQFEAIAGEFLGYAKPYRSAVTYVASNDGAYRGLSFYNLSGQEMFVMPVYYIVLYNPDKDSIIFGVHSVNPSASEITKINADLTNLSEDEILGNVEQLSKKAHEDMKKLLETTPRKDLSFGAEVDEIDKFFKSIES